MAKQTKLPSKTVIMLSGGIDSTVLAYYLRSKCAELRGVSLNYGQRNYTQARRTINKLSVELQLPVEHIDLGETVRSFLGFMPREYDDHYVILCESPKSEHVQIYEPASSFFGVMAVAASYTVAIGYEMLVQGYNKDDLNEDRWRYGKLPEVQKSIVKGLTAYPNVRFGMTNPFVERDKEAIIRLGAVLKVPLGDTWSCWDGSVQQCGTCPGCLSRKEGFRDVGMPDPTHYRDNASYTGSTDLTRPEIAKKLEPSRPKGKHSSSSRRMPSSGG